MTFNRKVNNSPLGVWPGVSCFMSGRFFKVSEFYLGISLILFDKFICGVNKKVWYCIFIYIDQLYVYA